MNQTGNGEEKNFRYLVLATGTLKQVQIAKALSERFPKEHGRIFLPEREYWIRKTKSIGKKPLFPGYLFAQTDMSQKELYLFVKENSRDILTYVNEVSVKGMKDSGAQIMDEIWNELTKEEAAFLDRMLDEDGVERMSAGYREGDRYVVMEGPLKGLEEHITENNRHDREASLDMAFREKKIVVGFIQRPKTDFFAKTKEEAFDKNVLILSNGEEVDLKNLANQMMGWG